MNIFFFGKMSKMYFKKKSFSELQEEKEDFVKIL